MSESDTMFNERDQRCAAVQLMLSTDLSYDNRTIASTLKMQQGRAQGDENKVSGYGYSLWYGFKWEPHHATSHLRSWLESQHQSVPRCAEECSDPLVQSGGRWQTLGVAAGLGDGPQVERDLGLASEGVLRLFIFVPFSHWPPHPPTWTRWTTSFGHTLRTSPTWPPKASLIAAIHWVFAELLPALVEKACSQFRIRTEVVIVAEGGYIE